LGDQGYKIPGCEEIENMSLEEKEYQILSRKFREDHERKDRECLNQGIESLLLILKNNPSGCRAFINAVMNTSIHSMEKNLEGIRGKETKDEPENVTIKILHLHKFI
jgi:hypothetical protein